MLRKFKVSNFKNFENDFVFDLSQTNGYEFNADCIKDGIVNSAIIYGYNGVGKSNLGLAIFDIIEHLTDKNKDELKYQIYLNANSKSKYAEFYYEFLINSKKVVYEYKKTDYKSIAYEKFVVDDEELVLFDRTKGVNFTTSLQGTETLKKEINNNELSVLKYIKSNTELDSNSINTVIFKDFFKFIDSMLYFRSLQRDRMYLGLQDRTNKNILEDIIEKDHVKDFESFLNEAGIECRLVIVEHLDKKSLAFDFNGKKLPFSIASTGTESLTLFYYWFQSIKDSQVSFLFIDEFDAFYHHELSALVVNKLKESGVQFILTTHNTSIITNDLLRPDCYFFIYKKKIKSLAKRTSKELREAHNIEKMYKAGAFDVE